jgi:heat shock protein HslJ
MAADSGLTGSGLVGTWELIALDGQPVLGLENPVSLVVQPDGSVNGFGGVNRYQSAIDATHIANGRLKFAQAVTTMMAGPPEAMELERVYLVRLGAASSFATGDGTLRLYAGDNEALTLTAVPDQQK